MEFIKGGTLKDLMQKSGTLSWREVAETGRQIAAALQHAHNHGIIHRDLKPGNVFITESGELKLGDFGIARDTHMQDLTEAGLTVGTYSYMAPELVRGERAITGQVDLYALGCLLYELLVGHPPYQGDNFAQIFDQHLNATPARVTHFGIECPAELDTLIQELLAKSPEDRPFNARAVQGILGHLLDPAANDADRDGDRKATDVGPAQEMLSKRVTSQVTSRTDVSWLQLTILLMGITIVVLVAMLANGS
jgi:serine/threonine protein kinase